MKGSVTMSWRLLTVAAASLLPLSVQAADMPKEGTDAFTNIWAITISNTIQQGTNSFDTYEINGVARNDAGGPMFNFFGLRCVGTSSGPGGGERSEHGTCTYTDKDGDNIFAPYTGKSGHGSARGTYEVAGGTGKFAGITGNGEWWNINPAPIKSDDKRGRGVIANKVSWKLP
jgi:hypothetical protein